MLKTLEQMNGEELLYVKDMIEKYLDGCKKIEDKEIREINEEIKLNNKDIKRLERKIEWIQAMQIDYFPIVFGALLSGIAAGLLCKKDITDGMESMGVFGGGTLLSGVINIIINDLKQKALNNIYIDEEDLEFIKANNNRLEAQKKKLLAYKSYNKKLKDFAER